MYVALVQHLHFVSCVLAGPNTIPSLIVPNLALQEVPLPIQDEHGNAMEDSEWVDKGSGWCCKVDACISFYVAKWLFHYHLERTHSFQMQAEKSRCSSIRPWGLKQQDHCFMNAHILSNLHVRQKRNEKKALDQVKKKRELEWDELQAQKQQMP